MTNIHFDHFQIRLSTQEDLKQYFDMIERNRPRLADFFTRTVFRTQSFEDTEIFLTETLQKAEERNYFPFIIVNLKSGDIAGFLDIKNIDWKIPKAELGSYTDSNYAGTGLTSRAFNLFVDYCFCEFQFKKLFLRTHERNIAARKLAEKTGFEIEGKIRRDYITSSGEIVDLIYYGKISQ
jgi:ribosomal-protein-serine acetyltransferase